MRRWLWTAGALATTVLAVGCAHQVKIDEAKLGELPLEDKQAIFAAQHNVTVAEANQESAVRALDQAKNFREMSKNELNASKELSNAAKKAMQLGEQSGNATTSRNAQNGFSLASKQLGASQAKMDYADNLQKLREQELQLAKDRVAANNGQLAFIQADSLRRHGIDPGVKVADVTSTRDQANLKVMEGERTVSIARDQVNSLKVAWDQRRQEFNVAQRESGGYPAVRPPAPPAQIEQVPIPPQPQPAVPNPQQSPPSGGQTM